MNFYMNSSLLTLANQLAQQQYQWGQEQFGHNSALTDQVVNDYLTNSGMARGAAQNDLSRYQNLFQPEENQLLSDANSFAGAPRIQAEMGRAASEAGQTSELQRRAALQDLESFGIDPSSGRYAALNRAQRAQEAASEAGAANTARTQAEQIGRGLRSEAIQVGQRYPGQVVNYLNTALQGLTGAENATLANANTGVNMMGSPTQWAQLGLSGANAAANARSRGGGGGGARGSGDNNPFGFGLGFNDRQSGGGTQAYGSGAPGALPGQPGGINSPVGTQGDWTPIPDTSGYASPETTYDWGNQSGGGFGDEGESFAEGGKVQPKGMIPIGDDATSGGHVPRSASPSRGAVTDDIPARLNADEFVIPRDAVQWKGHEFFHKLIKKSREDKHVAVHESGAKPKMKPALHAQPRFVSHHVHGALPIG